MNPGERTAAPSSTRSASRAHVDVLLVVLALAVVGPFVAGLTAQPASRSRLTAALWDRHTVSLEAYEGVLGVDVVVFDGELRSDKAPLQPLLGTLPYAAYRAVGGEPATVLRRHENLDVWWQTWWASVLPFALLLVLMRRAAARLDEGYAVPVALALGFGTLLLPYSTELYGHVLGALLAFGVRSMLRAATRRPGRCPRRRAPRRVGRGRRVPAGPGRARARRLPGRGRRATPRLARPRRVRRPCSRPPTSGSRSTTRSASPTR